MRPQLAIGVVGCLLGAMPVHAEGDPPDPLNSPAWGSMLQRFLPGRQVEFDERVSVWTPPTAENPLEVPVTIDVHGLGKIDEILVIADLNPIQKILSFRPLRAAPTLSFRFKVEQSTPVRAAVRTADGHWHVGGTWLSASGGGCTAPSGGSRGLWQGSVGAMNGRLWPRADGTGERLRLRVLHPMDTGLASGVPAFYLSHLTVRDASGTALAELDTFQPIAENPVFSLDLQSLGAVRVEGQDTQGDAFAAEMRP